MPVVVNINLVLSSIAELDAALQLLDKHPSVMLELLTHSDGAQGKEQIGSSQPSTSIGAPSPQPSAGSDASGAPQEIGPASLKGLGSPQGRAGSQATNPPAQAPPVGQGAPVCPTHGTPMLRSKKTRTDGKNWYCPKHVGPGLRDYCKERM